MTRRTAYLGIAGLLLTLLAWWFTRNYTIGSEEYWTGMRPEARANPMLAARLLLTRMGSKVEESSNFDRLSRFPVTGTLFLSDRSELTPTLTRALDEWVQAGGHLVIDAQRHLARDPLLQQNGISVRNRRVASLPPEPETITLPDGTRLQVALPATPNLSAPSERLDWWHEVNGAIVMLQLSKGKGQIVVMSSFAPFYNYALGRYQHADLLWHLVGGSPVSSVWLVRRLQTQSLPAWLAEHAMPALIALGIVLVILLWRVMPRFGPLINPPAPDRRSLTEHLMAMGRFYATHGQRAALLSTLREDALDALMQRAPEARMADDAARLRIAARTSGMRPRDLLYAFTHLTTTAREFTIAVRLLREFRQQLTGAVDEQRRIRRALRPRVIPRSEASPKAASETRQPKPEGIDA